MLTSKQRSYLGKLAADIPDIVFIGKNGINDEVIRQTLDNLKARELIKVKVQQNSPLETREASDELAKLTKSDVVRVIGRKFILYKKNTQKKENIIPSKKKKVYSKPLSKVKKNRLKNDKNRNNGRKF